MLKRNYYKKVKRFLALILTAALLSGCVTQNTVQTASSSETESEEKTDISTEVMTETETPEVMPTEISTEIVMPTEESTEIPTESETEATTEATTLAAETTATEKETEAAETIPVVYNHNYQSTLPVLYIDGNFSACAASKSVTVTCNYEITGDTVEHSGTLNVHSRGHASWKYAKKGYKLKLDTKEDLFGMGKNKHWVLISCYTEPTYMRDYLAAQLGGDFGLPVMDGTWVDVVVNGEYYGLYYLSEHVRVGKNRIDIDTAEDIVDDIAEQFVAMNKDTAYSWIPEDNLAEMMLQDMSWVSTDTFTYADVTFKVSDYYQYDKDELITSGYLVDVDGYLDTWTHFQTALLDRPISILTPEFAKTNSDMVDYVSTLFNTFETAIVNGKNTGNFTATYNGETVTPYDIIDLDSLVAYFWVQEIFMNADGGYRSFYLYKDADEDGTLSKFYVGPIWDMDYSSGGYRDGDRSYPTTGWDYCEFTPYYDMTPNNWAKYYIKDPVFQEAAYNFYKEHRSDIDKMIASIDGIHDYIETSAKIDQAKWGKWRHGIDTETETLKNWLTQRMAWLDAQMVSYDTFVASLK